ncbi:MAG: flagellar hook-associated protein FlgL [Candidatus Omnitrophica bacterium]|nr:flagellar hook-associated protein FlgL [Candidatus Omnitrophota bacterium]
MRVTYNSLPDSLADQLNRLSLQQLRLQNQAATGRRVQSPEDDPAAMEHVLELQTEGRSLDQYKENIDYLKERSTAAYDAIQGLKKISDRAGEIANLADGTKSPQELRAYATEITQLIQQGVDLANSKYNGEFLFAGTQSDQSPFSATLDDNGQVTAFAYQGNSKVSECEIGENILIAVQVPGANDSGSGNRGLITDTRTGSDFFNHLISLQDNLLAADTTAISATDRPALMQDEDNLVFHLGNYGAVQARLDAASASLSSRGSSVQSLISKEADADLADTLVRLNATQNAYQAALQSGAKLLNTSLMDYLP